MQKINQPIQTFQTNKFLNLYVSGNWINFNIKLNSMY